LEFVIAESGAQATLGVLLVIAGLMLVLDRPSAAHWQALWAVLQVVLSTGSVAVTFWYASTVPATLRPALATSWTVSDDGLTYTFTLRKGVKFHSGKALTSADVKYTFDRLVDKATASPNASLLAPVEAVTTSDDNTVDMTLKKPDASFLTNLSSPAAVIINKDAVEKNGDLTKTADGTGPFKFKEYVPNTRVVMERNPEYWESGKPYVDGIEMTIAADDTSRISSTLDESGVRPAPR